MKELKDYYRGCLLGGAVGDAMGWPLEFLRLDEIRAQYGGAEIDRDENAAINIKNEGCRLLGLVS